MPGATVSGPTTTLYRAVSLSELTDIWQVNAFRPVPSSLQGKWFEESIEMLRSVASTRLRWFSSEEGGRNAPPSGPIYTATAFFAGEDVSRAFSVVLRLPQGDSEKVPRITQAELWLLVPDRLPELEQRLTPGQRLFLCEGPRIVADGEVLAVHQEHAPELRTA